MTEPPVPAPQIMRERAIGRTGVQVSTAAAIVTIGEWLCALNDIDLNPSAVATELPIGVSAAITALLGTAFAWAMNRRPSDAS